MSKANNLTDFLTDIANTIRAKKGTNSSINPQNFSTEIANLPSGTKPALEKGVNFIDYDGAIVDTMTIAEAKTASALPSYPSHSGLTCQGWNWTLAQIKSYITSCENNNLPIYSINVGAIYITDNINNTRIYITLPEGMLSPTLGLTINGTITINWGDNSYSTSTGSGSVVYDTHTYAQAGDYVITIGMTSGTFTFSGASSGSYLLIKSSTATATENRGYLNCIKKIEMGDKARLGDYAFRYCYSLETITIPRAVTSLGSFPFRDCNSLINLNIPDSITSISTSVAYDCFSLKSICLPAGAIVSYQLTYDCYSLSRVTVPIGSTLLGQFGFYNAYALRTITIPQGITSISGSLFYGCSALTSIKIPNSVTTIESSAFYRCYALTSVTMPNNLSSIAASAFYQCYAVKYYDFRAATTVPTLSNISAFTGIPSDCKIIVPNNLYSSWRSATNWSTYASNIIQASSWAG